MIDNGFTNEELGSSLFKFNDNIDNNGGAHLKLSLMRSGADKLSVTTVFNGSPISSGIGRIYSNGHFDDGVRVTMQLATESGEISQTSAVLKIYHDVKLLK
jgi:hypothetical protein